MPKFVMIALGLMMAVALVGIGLVSHRRAEPMLGLSPAPTQPARPFRLTTHTGKTFTDADLLGKPTLLYFGFTFCPDICPTELGYVAKVMRALGADGDRVRPVFISVDPGRDTPQKLADYVPLFDKRLIGLIGSQAETDVICAAYGVFHQKSTPVSKDPTYYLIDHSSTIFLLDAQGRIADTLDSDTPVVAAVARVRRVLP
jgi:cytochrome oxidase Cu insertion factor (SCO1/SenC/PrrC family)